MKLSDLINQLQDIFAEAADANQDPEVVTRGSKATTYVDVLEVRTFKTSAKRRVVFIGKPAPQVV